MMQNGHGGYRPGAGRPSGGAARQPTANEARIQAGLDDIASLIGMMQARIRLLRIDPTLDPTTGELRAMAQKQNSLAAYDDQAA